MAGGGGSDVQMPEGTSMPSRPSVPRTSTRSGLNKMGSMRWDAQEGGSYQVFVVDVGSEGVPGRPCVIRLWNKEKQVCRRSLFYFTVDNWVRRSALMVVESPLFDRFILFCILVNSVLLAVYQYRGAPSPSTNPYNNAIDIVAGWALTFIFTIECALKILALGMFYDEATYLRDGWNVLDFVVVVSSLVDLVGVGNGGLGFLRLFRVLRPLRSLNRVPEMKKLVNSSIMAVPRLSNVAIMGAFLFTIGAIIGLTFFSGIFYRRCRATENPMLVDGCWQWAFSETAGRPCGGDYMCEEGEFCKGHEQDVAPFYPQYDFGNGTVLQVVADTGFPWCVGSEPAKWTEINGEISGIPETDFVHFDHIAGAFLLIFQCMTMEGWVDLMYYVQDSFGRRSAWAYFISLVIVTSFLLLNVALAVVDEALESFAEEEAEAMEDEEGSEAGAPLLHGGSSNLAALEENLFYDCWTVRMANRITKNRNFQDAILLVIVANVVVMMMDKYPPNMEVRAVQDILNEIFFWTFLFEMALELTARGPKGYIMNPFTAFDGLVVILAVLEKLANSLDLSMLRTFRLFRVLMKIQKKQPALGVLLKAMWGTAKALCYWFILFILVLYIFSLMMCTFFNNRFHFSEPNVPPEVFAKVISVEDPSNPGDYLPWCPGTENLPWNQRQDCIPRANFDTFAWGFVTVFQIMTGENWNTIMYAGMRAGGWIFAFIFVVLILFGQTLFLSLFLSMLITSYSTIQDRLEDQLHKQQEKEKEAALQRGNSSISAKDLSTEPPTKTMDEPDDGADGHMTVQPVQVRPRENHPEDASPTSLPGQLTEAEEEGAGKTVHILAKDGGREEVDGSLHQCKKILTEEDEDDGKDQTWTSKAVLAGTGLVPIPTKQGWPKGYSWFILHTRNPLRRAANYVLDFKVMGVSVFDNAILVCILVSTLCMIYDHPGADRNGLLWKGTHLVQQVFAGIFITEMIIKLTAYPLLFGEKAYLRDSWNILDATVVCVSILDFLSVKGPSFLKVLRILRALRPLRVINRNENLKLVVETIFKSMIELGWLLVVMVLFTMIFSLVGVSELHGHFYSCSLEDGVFIRGANQSSGGDIGKELYQFRTPLCFGDSIWNGSQPGGAWSDEDGAWLGSCTAGALGTQWQRGTIDTPICVAQCNPKVPYDPDDPASAPRDLCPERYTTVAQLPNNCAADGSLSTPLDPNDADELLGYNYVLSNQRKFIVPCGGSTVESAAEGASPPMASVSCRDNFCPTVDSDKVDACRNECKHHPYFCAIACKDVGDGEPNPTCAHCRQECEAECQCKDFCTGYVKDAAVCYEQGGTWVPTVSQNFNNIANAMLTLFEISTTEGWVDVMYTASDVVDIHMQPHRDTSMYAWIFFFVIWIFISFMFLVNLAVGIIADKFMDMQESEDFELSDWQRKWQKSRHSLYAKDHIYEMENLHLLPEFRRRVYDFVGCDREHAAFEKFIMCCIVTNTILMGAGVFPQPYAWFEETVMYCNYVFAAIFTAEAILKCFALRSHYFRNNWNIFDFVCVVSTLLGIVISAATDINIRTITAVIRIFRIARLFRLLRFLKELNKIFMALLMSLPGLVNVVLVLLLLLILFSILGVQLFGTVKQGESLNVHGNFQDFTYAFVTLFRACTGEAWNEIMHDLAKTEKDFFRASEPTWCTPMNLYDLDGEFDTLQAKCLIENPNTCVQEIFGYSFIPYLYWVCYTLLIGLVVLNLLITVILAGYAEGKKSGEEEHDIDLCKTLWLKYDPDHRMTITYREAAAFINEAVRQVTEHDDPLQLPEQPKDMSIRTAKAFDLNVSPEGDCDIHFRLAVRQVLRLAAATEGGMSLLDDLSAADERISIKQKQKIAKLEQRSGFVDVIGDNLAKNLAALKLQRVVRIWKARKDRQKQIAEQSKRARDEPMAAQKQAAAHQVKAESLHREKEKPSHYLRGAAAGEATRWVTMPATGISPPIAG